MVFTGHRTVAVDKTSASSSCVRETLKRQGGNTRVQEPHTDLKRAGACEGPCPTKWADTHWSMSPHLPAATTASAGIILLFLSFS